MEIILDENEIDLAIKNYVRSQINVSEDTDIEIIYKAGRGENGPTASIKLVQKLISENIDNSKPLNVILSEPEIEEKQEESVKIKSENKNCSIFDNLNETKN